MFAMYENIYISKYIAGSILPPPFLSCYRDGYYVLFEHLGVLLPFSKDPEAKVESEVLRASLRLCRSRYPCIHLAADVLSGLARHQDRVVVKVVDTLLEELHRGIEVRDKGFAIFLPPPPHVIMHHSVGLLVGDWSRAFFLEQSCVAFLSGGKDNTVFLMLML